MIRKREWSLRKQAGKPRASGDDPRLGGIAHSQSRVNPARAGMILRTTSEITEFIRKPRASGDDPPCTNSLPIQPQ